MFAAMLGAGRTLYARHGSSICKTLVISALGATVCYAAAAFSALPAVGLAACALTGLCTAMLWPGSLIAASDRFPGAGVAVFALMAAGGDLGGAIGPQLVGSVTDLAMASARVRSLSAALNLTTEQLSMKIGLLSAIAFPLLAALLYAENCKRQKRSKGPAAGAGHSTAG